MSQSWDYWLTFGTPTLQLPAVNSCSRNQSLGNLKDPPNIATKWMIVNQSVSVDQKSERGTFLLTGVQPTCHRSWVETNNAMEWGKDTRFFTDYILFYRIFFPATKVPTTLPQNALNGGRRRGQMVLELSELTFPVPNKFDGGPGKRYMEIGILSSPQI